MSSVNGVLVMLKMVLHNFRGVFISDVGGSRLKNCSFDVLIFFIKP